MAGAYWRANTHLLGGANLRQPGREILLRARCALGARFIVFPSTGFCFCVRAHLGPKTRGHTHTHVDRQSRRRQRPLALGVCARAMCGARVRDFVLIAPASAPSAALAFN